MNTTQQESILPFRQNHRVAVMIDGHYLYSGTRAMNVDIDYSKLRDFISESGDLVRSLYFTQVLDTLESGQHNPIRRLLDWLQFNGYVVVDQLYRDATDSEGRRRRIGHNVDVDMAVEMIKLARNVDFILLFTGNGSLCPAVREVQNMGTRVALVANLDGYVGEDLRRTVDHVIDLMDIIGHFSKPSSHTADRDSGPSMRSASVAKTAAGALHQGATHQRSPRRDEGIEGLSFLRQPVSSAPTKVFDVSNEPVDDDIDYDEDYDSEAVDDGEVVVTKRK